MLPDGEMAATGIGSSKPASRVQFDRFDTDGNGAIDAAEFAALCDALGRELTATELQLALKAMDKSGDGQIQYDEFMRWWQQGRCLGRVGKIGWVELSAEVSGEAGERVRQAISHFQYFDTDSSGSITKEEFASLHDDLVRHGFTTMSREECVADLDASGDGIISLNEYCDWLERLGSLSLDSTAAVTIGSEERAGD